MPRLLPSRLASSYWSWTSALPSLPLALRVAGVVLSSGRTAGKVPG
jgi:hypothetical protein